MSATVDIDALYARYGHLALRRIRRFFPDPIEAEEVLQEVFLKVIENVRSFRGASRPSTWLFTVTTHHCLSRLKQSKRRQELLDERGPGLEWGWVPDDASVLRTVLLRQLWRELDPELLQIAVYSEVDGMSHAQIAEILGVSRRTVGNRLAELAVRAAEAGGVGS